MTDNRPVVTECCNNIVEILQTCKQKGIAAIYTSIFPVGSLTLKRRMVWNRYAADSIVTVNRIMEDYCSVHGFGYFDAYNILLDDDLMRIKPLYERDFLHLNQEAYRVLNEELLNQFDLRSMLPVSR
jgi:lysophospholipase L1-like esterase